MNPNRNNRFSSASSNALFLAGTVLVVIICGVLYLSYNPTAGDLPPVAPIAYKQADAASVNAKEPDAEASQDETDAPLAPEADDIPRDEWFMRLVNFDNLLEEDFQTDVVNLGGGFYFDERAADNVADFLSAASDAGFPLRIVSASRSWENQQAQYNERVNELIADGLEDDEAEAQATRENMLPAASEHILSLGLDIVPESNRAQDETLLDEPAYEWMLEHAHEFGFIQRYPIGKGGITGMEFEPWHFRFVGVEQATKIYESGLTLEEYLA